MALRLARRTAAPRIDPSSLTTPDSPLARDAETAARDLLSPAVLNHSYRSFAWGAALAAVDGIAFDRELFYVAARVSRHRYPEPQSPTWISPFVAPPWSERFWPHTKSAPPLRRW